jgi:hypothetical protein
MTEELFNYPLLPVLTCVAGVQTRFCKTLLILTHRKPSKLGLQSKKLKLNLLAYISDVRHPPRRATAKKVGLPTDRDPACFFFKDRDPAHIHDPQSSSIGGRHDLARQIAIARDPALTAVTMHMIAMLHV